MTKELIDIVERAAVQFKIEPAILKAFIEVESSGVGFDATTGKIIIQFEPKWFKRLAPYAPSGKWSLNGVEKQAQEWVAFNDAFYKDKEAAMKSTSIGLGQIMGFHYERLGYSSVGNMWDGAKKGINQQVWQMCKFISTDTKLVAALKSKNWDTVAKLYNGAGYKDLAKKYHRLPYDESMKLAYEKYKL